ncbi:helix-turn-helix domain-containing protein [Chryseobacterium sp. B21-037]|uniref:helix-turn-helix domain-containing protein n=1 Tax=Chryseobacterium sp. B21-037 TaxID=2926038 RepID=UPI0023582252|nr:helix-turn-helix domain-containing protein [Chryseobacterium sp. B21-037]MDC8102925.1 helix-turn-helix domain-containing protein [Chryseobacterium sp. B21-037]MDC8107188.1 helix-turn-helix domain-containing protein [Chryseobacterium sp. B21-037]WBV56380.1 helix-turn-helix domain-containing protein [Chryseobacterium daecheongense]
MNNVKDIHIGTLIKQIVLEDKIKISRICTFLNATEAEINDMYNSESLDSTILLRWSKLLEYDLFRIFSQHLILYSPPSKRERENVKKKSTVPQFRKNIYTKELIDYIIEIVIKGEMSRKEVVQEYGIPKTTLYRWLVKYSPKINEQFSK